MGCIICRTAHKHCKFWFKTNDTIRGSLFNIEVKEDQINMTNVRSIALTLHHAYRMVGGGVELPREFGLNLSMSATLFLSSGVFLYAEALVPRNFAS